MQEATPSTCRVCASVVPPRRKTCSPDCRAEDARRRAAAWYAEHRDDPALKARVAVSSRAHRERVKADPANLAQKLAGVAAWRTANPDKRLQGERRWRAANPDRAKAKVQRRRARLVGAFVEDVDARVVFERDGGICGICFKPVDPALPWPHRFSKTLDHVIPLARGGTHEYANVQLAHASCNARKNDRVPETT